MRKEPFGVGDYVHVYNRGNRKMDIVRDNVDKWRFLACLRYYNDESPAEFLMREIFGDRKNRDQSPWRFDLHNKDGFVWPVKSAQKPIVNIVSYSLMPNHYHLLLQEIIKGGISEFARKLGIGFTGYTNVRYKESGRIFQGSYKARLITDTHYLQFIDAYIQALNPFELLPEGMPLNNFDLAFEQIIESPFTGIGESLGVRNFSILNRERFLKDSNLPHDKSNYKKFARDAIISKGLKKYLGDLVIEN